MGSKLRGMFGSLLGDSGHRPSLQRSLLPDAPQISEEELQFRIRDVRNELVSARIAAQKVGPTVCMLHPTAPWGVACCVQAGVYLPLKGRSEAMFRLPAALSSGNRSIAVSPLGTMLVVANVDNHSVSAYELPSGAFCFESGQGGPSKDPAAFNWPARVVYTKSGNLLVAERMNKRVQEFGPTHSVLRLIGVDVIPEPILSMDASESLIVVACQSQGDSVLLFDYSSGSLVHTFSLNISGALACKSVRISPDHQHILTVDLSSNGILVYSLEGDFVMSFGGKVLDAPQDLVVTDFGDIVVADCNHNRICVFSGTTLELLSSWGHEGVGLGCFMKPTALAFFGGRLYVADYFSDRIQVFT
jgi:DNA-binding beta-propeller fold protein YncE